jgi:pimeloyl-ACP methyl ester carboxylesterase
VVALDLPGHGASQMPRERISIPGYGRCVEALCDHLDLGTVQLVGNSMGGFVSCEVAIQFPERAERLVLVSAAGITTTNLYRSPASLFGRVATVAMAVGAARQRFLARRPRSRHMALALVMRHPSKIRPDMALEGLLSGTGKAGFQQALLACLDYDFRDRLPEIRCPALVVWGEDDMVLPVKDAKEFERLLPDVGTIVMKDTGHVAMAERPVTFNEELLKFLGASSEAVSGEGEASKAA